MTLPHHLQRLYQAAIANEVSAHDAHALRNTLGAISASMFFVSSRLEREGLLRADERVKKSLDAINTRVRDAEALADPRVDLPVGAATWLVLSDVVNELVASLAAPEGVRLLGPAATALATVVSRDELQLVLYCLIENAVEAVESKGGGTVRIRLDGSRTGCLVEVEDDGVGIDPDIGANVAHPFFTTKKGRLGMGLPIARRLIRTRLGGRLELGAAAHGGVRAAFAIAHSSKG